MRNMDFFMNCEVESKFEEVEIEGIAKFKFPEGTESAGKPIPWALKPITTDRLDQLRTQNTRTIKHKTRGTEKIVDGNRLTYELMVDTIIYPNFKDTNWLQATKCIDPVDLLKKVLDKPGDFSRISKECTIVNGLSETEEELAEEAKN